MANFAALNEALSNFAGAKDNFEAAIAGKAAADETLAEAAEVAKQKSEELTLADTIAEEALAALLAAADEVGISLPIVVPTPNPNPEPEE